MKFKKTAASQRESYIYTFYNAEGEEQSVKLVVGKDGVTAEDIKRLHAMDDAEVDNNIKSYKPAVEEWQKPAFDEWKNKHPYDELPVKWNISINELASDEENAEGEDFILDISSIEPEESGPISRFHEIVNALSETQKNIYRKIVIEEMSSFYVAREEQKCEADIRNMMNQIQQIIKDDEQLRRYFNR